MLGRHGEMHVAETMQLCRSVRSSAVWNNPDHALDIEADIARHQLAFVQPQRNGEEMAAWVPILGRGTQQSKQPL